jgi:hypothetical protein
MCGMFGGKEVVAQFVIAVLFFLYTVYSYTWYRRTIVRVFKQDEWIPDIHESQTGPIAEPDDDDKGAPPLLVAPNPGDPTTPKTEGLTTIAEKKGELESKDEQEPKGHRRRTQRSSSLSFEDAYQHPALKWQQERYGNWAPAPISPSSINPTLLLPLYISGPLCPLTPIRAANE